MWRSLASNALSLFIVVLLGVGIAAAMAQNLWRGPGPLTEAVCVNVPRGATMRSVSETLAGQGAVTNPMLFRVGADYAGRAEALKAGNFLIPPSASMEEIVARITDSGQSTCGSDINLQIGVVSHQVRVRELDPSTGEFEIVAEFDPGEGMPGDVRDMLDRGFARTRITVAEGTTVWQVVDGLNKAAFLDGQIDERPEEGMVAPGSYEVQIGDDRAALMARMEAAQADMLQVAWTRRTSGLPLESAQDALILASIVEKETSVPEERPAVASVFVNRLNQGMRLQTDPTVIYGLTEGEGTLGRGLLRSELARPTPWNTYTNAGLPPTPIANPGREAILAAVQPAETPYLFFVADGSGGHAFATTLAEHNANVRRWREIEAERTSQ